MGSERREGRGRKVRHDLDSLVCLARRDRDDAEAVSRGMALIAAIDERDALTVGRILMGRSDGE